MTRLNPLLVGLLRSPLHFPLSGALMLVTFTGRISGRRYTIPVGYQQRGETLTVMVSEARRKQWWRTFREGAPAALRIRGVVRSAQGRCVGPGSEAFAALAEQGLRRVPGLGRVFGVELDRRTGLRTEQIEHLAKEIAIVEFELEAPGRADRLGS